MIKIVDGRADMPGGKEENIADTGSAQRILCTERQVFLAGMEWRQVRTTNHRTVGKAGIRGDGFVAGIASDDAWYRFADYRGCNQRCQHVSPLGGKLP